jgi:hypothetical protein
MNTAMLLLSTQVGVSKLSGAKPEQKSSESVKGVLELRVYRERETISPTSAHFMHVAQSA